MKDALINGQPTPAVPDAPRMATCPNCGGVVKLRSRQGTYFWRHELRPRGGCKPQQAQEVISEPLPTNAGYDYKRGMRQVGDLVIELHAEKNDARGQHLKLRSLSAEADDLTSGIVVQLTEARLLARALLDAAVDLAGK